MLSEPANGPFICQHQNEAQSCSENIFLSANVMGAYFLHQGFIVNPFCLPWSEIINDNWSQGKEKKVLFCRVKRG